MRHLHLFLHCTGGDFAVGIRNIGNTYRLAQKYNDPQQQYIVPPYHQDKFNLKKLLMKFFRFIFYEWKIKPIEWQG